MFGDEALYPFDGRIVRAALNLELLAADPARDLIVSSEELLPDTAVDAMQSLVGEILELLRFVGGGREEFVGVGEVSESGLLAVELELLRPVRCDGITEEAELKIEFAHGLLEALIEADEGAGEVFRLGRCPVGDDAAEQRR